MKVQMTASLNDLANRAHQTARDRGFWDGDAGDVCKKLLLIHAEVSEAAETYRSSDATVRAGFAEELADVLIRTLDLMRNCGFDVDYAIRAKMDYNDTREKLHGKRF
jgi:NTP pyrophosphatase (non-canonical NTP hydrolase)